MTRPSDRAIAEAVRSLWGERELTDDAYDTIMLRATELDASGQTDKAVAEVACAGVMGVRFYENCNYGCSLPIGTKLYTHPPVESAQEGFVRVPREPTPEMISAGFDVLEVGHDTLIANGFRNGNEARAAVYRAMLAAAPNCAPAEGGGGVVTLTLPPENCRERLRAEGKPYPRSSCQACGKFAPKWKECEPIMAAIAAKAAKDSGND